MLLSTMSTLTFFKGIGFLAFVPQRELVENV